MIRMIAIIAGLFFPVSASIASTSEFRPEADKVYEIRLTYETSSESDGVSSSSSSGRQAVIERVIAVRQDGLELEYDLPMDATNRDHPANWQFPARIFKPSAGAPQLLNHDELAERVDRWLEIAEMPRTVCGRWIFTWNAFRIDCDPITVLATIEGYDLRPGALADGMAYETAGALGPAMLSQTESGPGGATFVAEFTLDPDAIRRARAESDLVVAEISGEALTMEEAISARAEQEISGTMTITFEVDSEGYVRSRTTESEIQTIEPDGSAETDRRTQRIERRLVSDADF